MPIINQNTQINPDGLRHTTGTGPFFERQFDGLNVVADFGAVGDGIVNDTVAIQNTIDAVASFGGGIVWFANGTFLVDGLTITNDNTILAGTGSATQLIPSGAATDLVTFLNVDFCAMRDIHIDGDWNGSRGVVLEGARWSVFDNIIGNRFSAPMIDLRADGAATQNVNNNTFRHIHAENATRFIRLQGDATNFVTLNEFANISAVGAGTAASILIDFVEGADTNVFLGIVRLNISFGAGDIGVVFNSGAPTVTNDVYGNHFLGELAIDQDAASTISVEVNDTTTSGSGPWPCRIAFLRAGGTNPTAISINDANAHIAQAISLGAFTDTSRPTAGDQIPGAMIFNTQDGFPNWSDGTNWVTATGATT